MIRQQPNSTWFDDTPQDPDLYRDAWCDECGDTQAIEYDGAWRCTVCGVKVETHSEAQS